jgi:hypothetical protein
VLSAATGRPVDWASVGPQDQDLLEVVFGGSTDVYLSTQKGELWRTDAAAAHFIAAGFDRFYIAPPYRASGVDNFLLRGSSLYFTQYGPGVHSGVVRQPRP